jgi:hypothetical protein
LTTQRKKPIREVLPEGEADRLAELLPAGALEDALEGLEPEQITGPGGLLGQLAGRVIETALGAERRGSILVRRGKGGRRREVGMDAWGWEQLRPWLAARAELPIGPLFCIIDGRTRGRAWGAPGGAHRVPSRRGAGGSAA